MYLLSQVWCYLLLAFLFGVLIGYFVWRVCSLPAIEARFARSRKEMSDRLSQLEAERAPSAGEPDTGRGPKYQPKT